MHKKQSLDPVYSWCAHSSFLAGDKTLCVTCWNCLQHLSVHCLHTETLNASSAEGTAKGDRNNCIAWVIEQFSSVFLGGEVLRTLRKWYNTVGQQDFTIVLVTMCFLKGTFLKLHHWSSKIWCYRNNIHNFVHIMTKTNVLLWKCLWNIKRWIVSKAVWTIWI